LPARCRCTSEKRVGARDSRPSPICSVKRLIGSPREIKHSGRNGAETQALLNLLLHL
jgi:hypothetical protein